MRWSLVAVSRTRVARHVRQSVDLEHDLSVEPAELATLDWSDLSAVALVGSDADLARTAMTLSGLDDAPPVAYFPSGRSDLLQMFRLDAGSMLERLQDGSRYATDLGICELGGVEAPFVSHLTATSPGRRPPSAIGISTNRRSHDLVGWRFVAANAQHVDGATIAPRAALMDGELDLQVFSTPRSERRRVARLAAHGLHLSERTVWRRSSDAAAVELEDDWRVKLDGATMGRGGFRLRVEKAAFDLWI